MIRVSDPEPCIGMFVIFIEGVMLFHLRMN